MTGSISGALHSTLRRFTLGSGPLKRRSDRVQMLGRLLVALALLAAAPLGVVAAGVAHGHLAAVAAGQAAERHVARAVVLTDTTAALSANSGEAAATIVNAEVTWSGPHGSVRRHSLLVPVGTAAGSTVPVWVDRDSGALTTSPMDAGTVGASSLAAGVAATVAVPLVVWALYRLLAWVLDVHRRRQWTQDWARVEREWRTRLS